MSNVKQTEPDKPKQNEHGHHDDNQEDIKEKGQKIKTETETEKNKAKPSQCHDPLAYRLSDMMIRLFMGEKILLSDLASEFNVSERTIYRDLHERLAMLDIECQDKRYFLSKQQYGARLTTSDLVRFAKMTYVDRLFPVLDNKLAAILTKQDSSPFIVYTYPPKRSVKPFSAFLLITQAILKRECLLFKLDPSQSVLPTELTRKLTSKVRDLFTLTADKPFHPYRLVYVNQEWFLVGSHLGKIWACRYEELINVKGLNKSFKTHALLLNIIESEAFIHALPHYSLLSRLFNLNIT